MVLRRFVPRVSLNSVKFRRLDIKLPYLHHKHLKSTNMLERMNQEIKRRTHIIRTFPNRESCLRMVRALAVETHEEWQVETRYLNMDELRESKKEAQYIVARRSA